MPQTKAAEHAHPVILEILWILWFLLLGHLSFRKNVAEIVDGGGSTIWIHFILGRKEVSVADIISLNRFWINSRLRVRGHSCILRSFKERQAFVDSLRARNPRIRIRDYRYFPWDRDNR